MRWIALLVGLTVAVCACGTETIGIEEITPGLRGEWRTVVSGTDVQSFELEVLGISENFLGPGRPVIICHALDAENRLSGPVAGMSGSPVYFEGRLAGAYAAGYTWSKEQAVIAVTPIADMLEIWESPAQTAGKVRPWRAPERLGMGFGPGVQVASGPPLLSVQPLPMLAGGFSARTLELFREPLRARGLELMAAPSGSSGREDLTLQPGDPLAAVLMTGDFAVAATGTVTWRDGDKLLGFGHPFFQLGEVAIPMAGAEVVTVVRSLPLSFKLAQAGPVVGSIVQDRLTGVAGEIGPVPEMIRYGVTTTDAEGKVQAYGGELFQHEAVTPVLAAMGLLQALTETVETGQQQTAFVDGEIRLVGQEPILLREVGIGSGGALAMALRVLEDLDRLAGNPYGPVEFESITFETRLEPTWLLSSVEAIHLEAGWVRAGERITAAVRLRDYRGEVRTQRVSFELPREVGAGEKLAVLALDAAKAREFLEGEEPRVRDFDDLVTQMRERPAPDRLHLFLVREGSGLRVNGEALPSLPPSVRSLFLSPTSAAMRESLSESVLARAQLETPGPVFGSARLDFVTE